jgi:SAM-dependent methyltransferase
VSPPQEQPRLRMYSDLAVWWPLLSPPSHYVEEAADLLPDILHTPDRPPEMMLELGSGGGSLASHFKDRLRLTLTDISSDMLAISRSVNPGCEHVAGDMRSLDLGRVFDVVFIHDAIMFATTADAVRETLRTAARHCRPGGGIVVVPDHVRETFEPQVETGGEDGPDGRGLRYVEWTWDPDPADTTYEVAYGFLLRDTHGRVTVEGEQQQHGCFARGDWLTWLRTAGFTPRVRTDPWNRDVFAGMRDHRGMG